MSYLLLQHLFTEKYKGHDSGLGEGLFPLEFILKHFKKKSCG